MSGLVRVMPAVLAVMMVSASCGNKVRIEGEIAQAPSSEVIVKLLDVNKMSVVDTVSTDDKGRFNVNLDIKKGDPEFVYLYKGDRKIASMLLEAGDKVRVKADTLGNYSVEGSEQTIALIEVEKRYAETRQHLDMLFDRFVASGSDSKKAAQIQQEIGKTYVDYYRSSLKYVMQNSHSLTVVPVLYQKFSENLPVFGQSTDAIHFSNICDSLETVYPDSRYVKALRSEARNRSKYLEFEARLKGASEVGYPDFELPNIMAEKVRLSDVNAKVIMLQFWSAANPAQKMFNLDVLRPVYNDFHKRGFEIYQVSLDVDKSMWAGVVKEQNLPWISVCDARGADSPLMGLYNIPALPATYIISNGQLVDGKAVDAKSLRALLDRLLK